MRNCLNQRDDLQYLTLTDPKGSRRYQMKTFTVKPITISKETKAKVVQTAKTGATAIGSFLGAVGGAFVTVMAHETNCRNGLHEINMFGTCRYCHKQPLSSRVVVGGPVMVMGNPCNHTWAKADSSTVSCLNCGKRLSKYSWSNEEEAWAKALLKQLED